MSDRERRPAAPKDLQAAGRRLWREIVGTYELRVDERRVLEEACREVDLIEQMRTEQAGSSLTARGSQGQPVAAPLVTELRQHRALVARLLAGLGLPDGAEVDANMRRARSDLGRRAARARWSA